MKEWTTPDSRNTPSTTNLEEEEIVDGPGNDGNASMPEQIKRLNPWRKMMIMLSWLEKKLPGDHAKFGTELSEFYDARCH